MSRLNTVWTEYDCMTCAFKHYMPAGRAAPADCPNLGCDTVLVKCRGEKCKGHMLADDVIYETDGQLVSETTGPIFLVMYDCKDVPEDQKELFSGKTYKNVFASPSELRDERVVFDGVADVFAFEAKKKKKQDASEPVSKKKKSKKGAGAASSSADAPPKKKGPGRPNKKAAAEKWVANADSWIKHHEGVSTISGIDPKILKEVMEQIREMPDDKDRKVAAVHKALDPTHLVATTPDGEQITAKMIMEYAKKDKMTLTDLRALCGADLGVKNGEHLIAPVSISVRAGETATLGGIGDWIEELHDDALAGKDESKEDAENRHQYKKMQHAAKKADDALNAIKGAAALANDGATRGTVRCLYVAVEYDTLQLIFLRMISDLVSSHLTDAHKKFKTTMCTNLRLKKTTSQYICATFAVSDDYTQAVELLGSRQVPYDTYHVMCSDAMVDNASVFKNKKTQAEILRELNRDLDHRIPKILKKINPELRWAGSPAMRKILLQTITDIAVRQKKAAHVAEVMRSLGLHEFAAAHMAQHMMPDELTDKSAEAARILKLVQNTYIPVADEATHRMVSRIVKLKPKKSKKSKPDDAKDSDSDYELPSEPEVDDEETDDEEVPEPKQDDDEYDSDNDAVLQESMVNPVLDEILAEANAENKAVADYIDRHQNIVKKRTQTRQKRKAEAEAEPHEDEESAPAPSPAKNRKAVEEDAPVPAAAAAVALVDPMEY